MKVNDQSTTNCEMPKNDNFVISYHSDLRTRPRGDFKFCDLATWSIFPKDIFTRGNRRDVK